LEEGITMLTTTKNGETMETKGWILRFSDGVEISVPKELYIDSNFDDERFVEEVIYRLEKWLDDKEGEKK